MAVVKDMQGLVFGRLTVTGDSGFRTKSGEVLWDCLRLWGFQQNPRIHPHHQGLEGELLVVPAEGEGSGALP